MQIEVRAFPAPGHEYRRRAGRAWSVKPTIVTVTDTPSGDGEITPAQMAALKSDPMIAVVPVGAATSGDLDLANARAELAAAQAELEKLRAELADALERIESDGERLKQADERDMRRGERIGELEAQIDALKAKGKR